MSEPTPLQRLGMYVAGQPEHGYALEACVRDLYARLEKLEVGELPKRNNSNWVDPDVAEFLERNPEGHPIPDYDGIQKGLDAWQKADEMVDNLREATIEMAELDLIDATLDYVDHYQSFSFKGPMSTKECRDWGNKSHDLHTKMIEAGRKLKDI